MSGTNAEPSSSLLPRILGGSLGSVATALAVTPLEVVKVRQQAATAGFSASFGSCRGCPTLALSGALAEFAPRAEGGTLSTLASISRNEGSAGLYAGLRPTLAMSVPNTVLYFTAYDEISAALRRSQRRGRSAELEEGAGCVDCVPLVAGSSARVVASLATAPFELIRTRQAGAASGGDAAAAGMTEQFRLLLRTNGVSSLYVGLAPTLWRDVPFSAVYWMFLERFRGALSDLDRSKRGEKAPPSVEATHAFISGAAAGSIASAVTTPFDVVKTRRQMNGRAKPAVADSCKACPRAQSANMGTFDCMWQIVQQEGITGLWKGNATRMVKVAPACAIMISCYEFGKRMFGEVL